LYENAEDNSFHFGSFDLKSIGDISANAFIKNGANSNDFLKGDGSIDGNAYLTASDMVNYVNKNQSSTINGSLTADSFIKTAGTNIQYLMADGSTLTQSANSGNSNFYLYNSGTSESTTPASGYITYNNATQSSATIIYISHMTRDNFDIEVYFNQITTLTEVYIQDQNESANYIQFNITAPPTITTGSQIAIPVLVSSQGTTGFANGHNVFISFFTNGLEVDTRLSALETKTINQTGVSGTTTFSGDVVGGAFKVSGQTGFLKANGNIDNNTYLTTANASSTYLPLTGGALTGQVTTTQTPLLSTQLVPKSYVDNTVGNYLPLTGGALTGQVSTTQTPLLSTQLVPKSYVDNTVGNYLPLTGGSIGNNYITTTQTVFNASGQLVPKSYVDTAVGVGTNNTTERWVNSYIGSDTYSGSVLRPLATLDAGFGNSAQYPLKLNIRGVFTTLQTITGSQPNLQITTTDGWEAQQTTLNNSVITSGTATRLKMSGFTISTTGTIPVLQFGDTLGRHAFSNMTFVSSNTNYTPITFNAGFTNWCDFQDCDFSGLQAGGITLPNLSVGGTAILRLYNCGILSLITGTGWTVYISGSTVLTTQQQI
jgi:hypothetical protein